MIRAASALLGAGLLAGMPFLVGQEPAVETKTCCQADTSSASLASLPSSQAPQLAEIAKLAGTWVEVGEDGQPTDTVVSNYRVTAGGSAVIETLFPGTEHEMISLYHMDGGDLLLTHYCVLGNAPTYRAERVEGGLIWRCQGARNLAQHGDAHMHEGRTEFVGKNRMRGQWLQTEGGEVTYTAAFDLVRRTSS